MTSCDYLSRHPFGAAKRDIGGGRIATNTGEPRHVQAVPVPRGYVVAVTASIESLDVEGLARLDQVLIGLLPASVLPPADVYVAAEGTPVASRDGDTVVALKASRWPRPAETFTDAPVV